MSYTVTTFTEKPDLAEQCDAVNQAAWPAFMLEDDVAYSRWGPMLRTFSDFQFALCTDNGDIIAAGNSIPLVWDGTVEHLPDGWDGAILRAFDDHEAGRAPNTLCAISITIALDFQGQGFSTEAIKTMKAIAAQHSFGNLIAPVRPTLKSRYPLIPMEQYIRWQGPDDAPFDPWLRVHWRLGGEILRVAPQSMVITGTIEEWENWIEMPFPESGDYVIPGGLEPVRIDHEQNQGRYVEPNVWVRHVLGTTLAANP